MEPSAIHERISLDDSVEQTNESHQHWAVKSAIINQLRSDSEYRGTIQTEKKTADLIADIRCELTDSPPGVPNQFVVEIETSASNKDRLRATKEHLRFGYAVYWVFLAEALDARTRTEDVLQEHMSSCPSLGVASLEDGEISLGSPILWDEFTIPTPHLGRTELSIPTHDRNKAWYNHGDFELEGRRMTIYDSRESEKPYVAWYRDDGQQTLPKPIPWEAQNFLRKIKTGAMKRVSPVRGPP